MIKTLFFQYLISDIKIFKMNEDIRELERSLRNLEKRIDSTFIENNLHEQVKIFRASFSELWGQFINSNVIQILADCTRIFTFCYSLESQVIREVEILGDKIHQTPGIDLMRET